MADTERRDDEQRRLTAGRPAAGAGAGPPPGRRGERRRLADLFYALFVLLFTLAVAVLAVLKRFRLTYAAPIGLFLALTGGIIATIATQPNYWPVRSLRAAGIERWRHADREGAARLLYWALARPRNAIRVEMVPTRVDLGRVLWELGRFDEAEYQLRRVILEEPADSPFVVEAKIALADVMRSRRRFAEAESLLLDSLGRWPTGPLRPDVAERLVELARDQGDVAKERGLLERLAAQDNNEQQIWARLRLAELARRTGDLVDAIGKYRAVVTEFPDNPSAVAALSAIIELALQMRDPTVAEAGLADLRERSPADAPALLAAEVIVAAALLEFEARRAEGVDRLRAALQRHPGSPTAALAAFALAGHFRRQGDPDQAASCLNEFLASTSIAPLDRANAIIGLAEIDLARGNPDGALARLATLPRLSNDLAPVQAAARLRVAAFAAKGDWEQVRAARRQLAELWVVGGEGEKLGLWAEVEGLTAARRYGEAAARLEDAAARSSDPAQRIGALQRAAMLWRMGGDLESERRLFARLADDEGARVDQRAWALLQLAANHRQQGDNDEALRAYARVETLPAADDVLRQALQGTLEIYVSVGDRARAEQAAARIAARLPTDREAQAEAHVQLAYAAAAGGGWDETATELEALAAAPAPELRRRALRALVEIRSRQGRLPEAGEAMARLLDETGGDPAELARARLAYEQARCSAAPDADGVAALAEIAGAERDGPLAATAWKALAQCQLANGRFDDAAAALERARAEPLQSVEASEGLAPLLADVRLGKAERLRAGGDLQGALAAFALAEREASSPERRAVARLGKARTLSALGRGAEALTEFRAVAGNPEAGPNLVDEARLGIVGELLARGDTADAERICQDVERQGADPVLRLQATAALGDIANARGQYGRARQQYEKARDSAADPAARAQFAAAIGGVLLNQRQYDAAAAAFQGVLAQPAAPLLVRQTAQSGLARVALARNRADEALAAFQAAVELDAESAVAAEARVNLARLCAERERFDEARDHYREALRRPGLSPESRSAALLEYARLLNAAGREAEAAAALGELAGQASRADLAEDAELELARLAAKEGRLDEARRRFVWLRDQARENRVRQREAVLGLAEVDCREQRFAEAVSALGELVKASAGAPEKIEALTALARAQFEAGDLADAERSFAQVAAEAPAGSPAAIESLIGRARVQLAQARFDQATPLLARAADLGRGRPAGLEALRAWAEAELDRGQAGRAERPLARLAAEHPDGEAAALALRLQAAERLIGAREFDQARALLTAAMSGDGAASAEARLALARLEAEEGRIEQAAERCRAVAADFAGQPAGARAELQLAGLARRAGQLDQANREYAAIAERHAGQPVAAEALLAMGALAQERDDPREAEGLYRRVAAEYAGDRSVQARARLGAAEALTARGLYTLALREYDGALEAASGTELALWAMLDAGRLCRRIGEDLKAEEHWKKLIALGRPNHPAVEQAKEELDQLYRRK